MPLSLSFAILCGLAAAGFAALALFRSYSFDSRTGWPTTVALMLAVVALVSGWFGVRKQEVEHAANKVVRALAGPGLSLRCRGGHNLSDHAGHAGEVAYGANGAGPTRGWLSRDTCVVLGNWLRSDKQHPTLEQITAVHVVVHEAGHLAGDFNEAGVECWAMARDAQAAEILGATRAQAVELARRYRTEVWPRMPAGYRQNC